MANRKVCVSTFTTYKTKYEGEVYDQVLNIVAYDDKLNQERVVLAIPLDEPVDAALLQEGIEKFMKRV